MSESAQEPRRIRAGDADRERVVAELQSHREAGRLTAEEFEERMESALMARWLDELPPLLSDLPGPQPGGQGAPRPGREGSGPAVCRPGLPGPMRPLMLLAPLLVVAALAGSVVAVAHGHFPFPLLWLAAAAWWFGPWWRWRRHAWPRAWAARR